MSNIKLIKTDYQAKIILSAPPLNILGIKELEILSSILDEINKDNNLKLLTIESDQKVFSAGVDISDHSKENIHKMLKIFHSVFFKKIKLKIPTVSLVKSGCIGGGCELALFCDFVLASKNAYFSQPEIKIGCYPPVSIAYLPYITGHKKSLEMILTGNKMFADEALSCGLVNKVFQEDSFDSEAENFIKTIVSNSSSILQTTLKTYKKLHYSEIKNKIELAEKIYLDELMELEDCQEGIKSFFEKRSPVWKGK